MFVLVCCRNSYSITFKSLLKSTPSVVFVLAKLTEISGLVPEISVLQLWNCSTNCVTVWSHWPAVRLTMAYFLTQMGQHRSYPVVFIISSRSSEANYWTKQSLSAEPDNRITIRDSSTILCNKNPHSLLKNVRSLLLILGRLNPIHAL